MRIFKVRNKDGKFSTGTSSPVFNKCGKTWSRLSFCTCSLQNINDQYGGENVIPVDWEIVEYELVEVKATPAYKLVNGAISSDEKKIKDIIK